MKRVLTTDNITQAGLVQSLLAQHDIQSQLRNEYASSVIGELPYVNSWPEVWVADQDEVSAKELIRQAQAPSDNSKDWRCSNCSEINPVNFQLCWQCNTSN